MQNLRGKEEIGRKADSVTSGQDGGDENHSAAGGGDKPQKKSAKIN